jgi:putative salt-induced outer membrane protein YdiY
MTITKNLRMAAISRSLLVLLAISISSISLADVLVLKNGDRITGDIKKIWDSEVSIEPSYADEFTVDAAIIDYIESDNDFDIELSSGEEVVAQLSGVDDDGNQLITVNGESQAISVAQLYELDEIDDPIEWDSNIDLSASLNTGNTESLNTKLHADTELKLGDHRHLGDISFIREEQNQVSTKEQDMLTYNYNWLFRDPWFVAAGYRFERDPIRNLDNRSIISGGLGRDIWNNPRLTLSIQLSAGFITEKIADTDEESSTGLWSLRYRQDLFSEDLEIYHDHSIVRYLSGRDNTIYKTTTGLRYEITDLLYATFSVDFDYETQPAEGVENEDLAMLFGVGVEF